MSLLRRYCLGFWIALAPLILLRPAESFAVSCTTQAQMSEAQRDDLIQSAKKIALAVQSGNTEAARALTVSNVAAQFDPIANSIRQLAPQMAGATITIDALFGLDASDLKSTQEETQFFCAAPNSALHEEISIPQLPPGKYALALVHATGVRQPQQMGLLLAQGGAWQLAGFFVKPLLVAGHDSVWYWTQARLFAQKGEKWNAHFYYALAAYLASPVDFLRTPNLEKLEREQAAVKPVGLPGDKPVPLTANGQTYSITNMHTDSSLGGLDLVVRYATADASDPVATRTRNLEVMRALLKQHPELRTGFHGLWVFADAPSQRPFGIEQPMSEIH